MELGDVERKKDREKWRQSRIKRRRENERSPDSENLERMRKLKC